MSSTLRAPRGASPAPSRAQLTVASMTQRVIGAIIDFVLVVVVSGLLVSWLDSRVGGVTRVRIDATTGERAVDAAWSAPAWFPVAVFVLVMALYTVPLMALWGRTVGGWCMGIRCVRASDGGTPGWTVSSRRWLVLYGAAGLLSFVPVVGPVAWLLILVVGLSPLWDASHRLRGYADHLAGDLVVTAPRQVTRGDRRAAAIGGPRR